MKSTLDILAVGDVVTDAFIKLLPTQAEINSDAHDHHPLLCMTYGTKIPFEDVTVIPSVGNSPNAAVACAKLGLKSALYSQIGDDREGHEILRDLDRKQVSTQFVGVNPGKKTNYHYVLWYKDDRTILIKHEKFDYRWPKIPDHHKPRWLYLSSLGESSLSLHNAVAEYMEQNQDIKLAFQPGTFQISFGVDQLLRIYRQTYVFFCNLEEAQKITGEETNNIKTLADKIHSLGPKVVVITNGPHGSFTSDGDAIWSMPIYPDPKPPYERTGAGDAFSSTFTAALAMGKDIKTALSWAPINAMSVVQKVGAQAGLLSKNELYDWLKKAPADYQPRLLEVAVR